jgi:subtilase family protein/fervidolysin-like protein/predicted actin-binding protein
MIKSGGHRAAARRAQGIGLVVLMLVACLPWGASTAAAANGGASAHRHATNQLLVRFRSREGGRSIRAALARVGAREVGRVNALHVRVVAVPDGQVGHALRGLRRMRIVAKAERNVAVNGFATPNDMWWPNEWSEVKVNAPQTWDVTTGSPTTVVAIVDTGVDYSQPDLQGSFVAGYDTVNNDSNPSDDDGHGTLVSGVALARGNNATGVAGYCWSCSLMPVKGLGPQMSGTIAQAANAITWAADHGARVINMSWGTTTDSATLAAAISYAHNKGAVLVAAAGNYGTAGKVYPAAYPSVIGVAGTDSSDTLYPWSSYGSWVKVAAPGCNYATGTSSWYGSFCGTSSASPAVAGIAGLLVSANPAATNTQIEQAIESSATAIGPVVEYGRVDAYAALQALGSRATGSAPALASPPLISGTAQVGQALSASTGSWSGPSPAGYSFQWRRCDSTGASCSDVSGATAASYTPVALDVGYALRVVVQATNAYGASTATSDPTAPVLSAGPAATATASYTGSLSKKQTSQSYSLNVGSGLASATLVFTRASSLTVTLRAADGSVVGSSSGPSVLSLIANLPAGRYTFTVSGASANFTLSVGYPTP